MKRPKNKKVVLVLEAHTKASVPIIESLGALGLFVVAGSPKRHCCGLYSRACKKYFLYPRPEKEPDLSIRTILSFIRSHDIEVLFPAGDVMTDLIARHQDEIRKYTKLILPSYDIFERGRDKIHTLKAAENAGCPIPKTWYPQNHSIKEIADQVDFPVLIKPAISAGSRGIVLCQDKEELLQRYPQVLQAYDRCFIQDYVPQDGMQYKVDVVVSSDGKVLAGVVYAKLRYYPPGGGSSVLNRTEHRSDILECAIKVIKELNWVGFCDFDFITDSRDQVVKLMEINPRFPESYRATLAGGVDMTRIIYELAVGNDPPPQLEYRSGRYLRFLFGDLMWFLTTKENRFKVKPSFFKFFGKDTVYQLLSLKDIGPIIGYMIENVILFCDKKERQNRLRL